MLSDNPEENIFPMALTRTKRDAFLVEIRKTKNRNLLQEKRLKLSKDSDETMTGTQEEELIPIQFSGLPLEQQQQQQTSQMSQEVEFQLRSATEQFSALMQAESYEDLTPIVKFLRESIGSQQSPIPGKLIIETGLIPPMLNFLCEECRPFENLQVEIVWLLANIASGTSEETAYLVEQNVIPALSACLKEEVFEKLHENILWTFANISGDSNLSFRDYILQMGVLDIIVRELSVKQKPVTYSKIAAWLISNLVRGKTYPPFEKVTKALPALAQLIKEDNEAIKQNALLSLIYLSEDSKDENLKAIAENNIIPKVIKCIAHKNNMIARYAVRVIGNIGSGTKDLLKNHNEGILEIIPNALRNPDKSIRKEACSTLAAVFSNTFDDHDYVQDHDIIPILVKLAAQDEDEIKSLATLSIFKYIANSSTGDAGVVIENEMLDILLQNLTSDQVKLVDHSLLAFYKILEIGETIKQQEKQYNGKNPCLVDVLQKGGALIVENLHNFPDEDIVAKVAVLAGKFFTKDSDWSDELE